MAINIVEQCQVSPSQGAVAEQLLQLLYFDIVRLPSPLIEILFFYNFQCSESHFFDTVVPNLKNSLSITLKHFPPLADKIVFPLNSGMPVSRYVAGEDSISLTIALSNADFVLLTGNHFKDADEFHDFVPQMLPATHSSDFIKFSIAAIQVTLFPDQGICIGFTIHHAIGDGATLVSFMQTWASISKFNGDAHLVTLGEKVLPFYDRSIFQDANRLATVGWNYIKMCKPTVCSTKSMPTYNVQGRFVLTVGEIQKLRKFVLNKKPNLVHVSSFTVACGHLWSCIAKLAAATGEEVADDEPEYLTFAADCRPRLNPPLPPTYFGNCLAIMVAESSHGRLKGNEGFIAAAEAIGETIHKTVSNDGRVLDGSESGLLGRLQLIGKRVIQVGGSPRIDLYGVDYGWGGPKKLEFNIKISGAVPFCKSREGGIEIGLSMPKVKMEAFAGICKQGLREATENI